MSKARSFDTADYLDSPEIIAAYLAEIFESGDPLAIGLAEAAAVARALAQRLKGSPPASCSVDER
jgi:DNA-binding phage protein